MKIFFPLLLAQLSQSSFFNFTQPLSLIVKILLGGIGLSLLVAGIFFLLLRVRAKNSIFFISGLLPTVLTVALIPNLRVFGYHGWLQAGIVYRILAGNIPPLNPLFWGEKVFYPWGYPLLLALISKVLNVSPFYAAALASVLSLIFLLVMTFKIAQLFTPDRTDCLFATFVSLYAFTFSQGFWNPFQWIFKKIFGTAFIEIRAVPILEKFNGCTGFPLGIAFFAAALYFLLVLFNRPKPDYKSYAALFLSILGVGFFYPLLLPGVVAGLVVVSGFVYFQRSKIPASLALALLFLSLLILIPYLYPLSAFKHEAARFQASFFSRHEIQNLGILLVTVFPISAILFSGKTALLEIFKIKKKTLLHLMLAMIANMALFLLVRAPIGTEYKFLSLASYGLGILGGICFSRIYAKKRFLCFLLMSLFLQPLGTDLVKKIVFWKTASESYEEKGIRTRPRDKDEAEVDDWILTHTKKDDVFIDSKMTLPIFASRVLFIGWDADEEIQGYNMTVKMILKELNGYDPKLVDERWLIVENLLSDAPLDETRLRRLAQICRGHDVYLLTRSPEQKRKFSGNHFFTESFHNQNFALFRMNPPGSSS